MTDLPSGTVTFLFSDIEGSTRLWEEHPDAMRECLARSLWCMFITSSPTTSAMLDTARRWRGTSRL